MIDKHTNLKHGYAHTVHKHQNGQAKNTQAIHKYPRNMHTTHGQTKPHTIHGQTHKKTQLTDTYKHAATMGHSENHKQDTQNTKQPQNTHTNHGRQSIETQIITGKHKTQEPWQSTETHEIMGTHKNTHTYNTHKHQQNRHTHD